MRAAPGLEQAVEVVVRWLAVHGHGDLARDVAVATDPRSERERAELVAQVRGAASQMAVVRRDEAYWAARNALVDAVRAVDVLVLEAPPHNIFEAEYWDRPGAAEKRARYTAAHLRLMAFDAEHGGTPIL